MAYEQLLEEWAGGLPREEALIEVFRRVRDIPFQFIGSRDVESMLRAGAGTCNAKHMLLKSLLELLGYRSRYVVDEFMLSDFLKGLNHSDRRVIEMERIAHRLKPYYHIYLQIMTGSRWVSVDITFDSALAPYGFVVAARWDGKTDTRLPHRPMRTYIEEGGPDTLKEKLLANEPELNKALRKEFFAKLNDYIASLRGH